MNVQIVLANYESKITVSVDSHTGKHQLNLDSRNGELHVCAYGLNYQHLADVRDQLNAAIETLHFNETFDTAVT